MGEEKLKIKGGTSRRLARTKLKIRDSILPFELFVPLPPCSPCALYPCVPSASTTGEYVGGKMPALPISR